MTVQLKPRFLPRLIINSPTISWSVTGLKKPPQDLRKWLDQVRPFGVFRRLGADAVGR